MLEEIGNEVKHGSLDLETLGINSNAPVTQIGFVVFTETKIIDKLDLRINFEDAFSKGVPDASTIKWWITQKPNAKEAALNGHHSTHAALIELYEMINKYCIQHFWAHATFDFPIIASLYNTAKVKSIIDFRKCRDLRTLEMLFGNYIDWPKRTDNHHSAIDDALYQTLQIQKMLKVAREKGVSF